MSNNESLQWLHISDLHFKEKDAFDRQVIVRALLDSLPDLKNRGLQPDLIFVTGDIANFGKAKEYDLAGQFFDNLLEATGVDKSRLFVVPGNHDVDRAAGRYLMRTLSSTNDADDYFDEISDKPHIAAKLKNYSQWHDRYFSGIRSFAQNSSVGYSEEVQINGIKLRINGLNTAAFCQDDHDHGKLWLGRRCLIPIPEKVDLTSAYSITLSHHPLEWLHEGERSVATALIRERSDFVLRGHLHETDVEQIAGVSASALHLAAGATYQTEKYPNRALFGTLSADGLCVVPIRYEATPKPVWTIDTSVYPTDRDFSRTYPHARTVQPCEAAKQVAIDTAASRSAKEAFEQDLFVTFSGRRLYAEPRLMDRPHEQVASDDGGPNRISIESIVKSTESYLIEAPREYGATSLSRRLRYEIETLGESSAQEHDANRLPNYRKKLLEIFGHEKKSGRQTLILDGFDYTRHERLVKEISSLNLFDRLIVLVSDKGLRQASVVVAGDDDLKFERVFLWALGRSEIRTLAAGLFDTADESLITNVVDKVYVDLLDLCIPLTPSNVLMYMRVLKREEDFYPLNRVDILDRYLTELIRRPSDNTTASFNAKSKLNLISHFVYEMFADGAHDFTKSDWDRFCSSYKSKKLCDFDEDDLLNDLISARVVFGSKSSYYLKYSFFYHYFVGRHLANNRPSLSSFISTKSYYNLPGAVEAVSGLLPDNTELLTALCDELDVHHTRFFDEYMKESFDPFSSAVWIDQNTDSDKFWLPIEKSIEDGPKRPDEIDLLKTSILSEARTTDQQVRFDQFSELEDNIFTISGLVGDALKCSDSVDGELKKRAVRLRYKTSLIIIQVGTLLANVIAENRVVRWGGLSFVNWDAKVHEKGDNSGLMHVLREICKVVAIREAEVIGISKLGEVFKAVDLDLEVNRFSKLQVFCSVLSSKPEGWVVKLKKILEESDRRGYYFMQMLLVLFDSFKHDVHTASDRQSLKGLIAYIRTKRELKIDAPGKKAVTKVLVRLEELGDFKD